MVSPSSVTTSRTVPCIAGCEGPRLTVIGAEGSSSSRASGSVIGIRIDALPPDVGLAHGDPGASGARARAAHQVGKIQLRNQRLPLARRVVLAPRMAHALGVH